MISKLWSRIRLGKEEATNETGFINPPVQIYLTKDGTVFSSIDEQEMADQYPNQKIWCYGNAWPARTFKNCGVDKLLGGDYDNQ